MPASQAETLASIVDTHRETILEGWLEYQRQARGRLDADGVEMSRRFLHLVHRALQRDGSDGESGEWSAVRDLLADTSRQDVRRGVTATETATFVFSLKEPVFRAIREAAKADPERLAELTWEATRLLDRLGLYTTEVFQRGREDLVVRQQQEMLELSTPVVMLWDGILALPVIGTLDSARTQVVMESLLQRIVDTSAELAIIDITGVPTVDTLVAQHLLKTVAAARLMGADCIISGIRPQIAQTIVHLGVDLGAVITKATLADAFAVALRRRNLAVRPVERSGQEPAPTRE
jgi:rsbT co-antagonist protein RsbR